MNIAFVLLILCLAFDIPQRHVDCGNGRHGDGPPAPISTPVQVLPDVLDHVGVATNQTWRDMLCQIGNNGHLATIDGRITKPVDPVVSDDLYSDEVSAGATYKYFDVFDIQFIPPFVILFPAQEIVNWSGLLYNQ